MKEITLNIWDPVNKVMSGGMVVPMAAGYIMGMYHKPGGIPVGTIYLLGSGVEDIKGVEVFQGDIVKADSGDLREIVWIKTAFMVQSINNPWSHPLHFALISGTGITFEKIGNRYQNPELGNADKWLK